MQVEEVSAFELPELSVVRFRLTTPLREKRVREVSLPGWVLSLQAMQSAVGSAPLGGAPKRRRGADGLSTWAGGAAPRAQPGSPPVLGSVMNRSVDADAVWLSVVVPYRLLDPQVRCPTPRSAQSLQPRDILFVAMYICCGLIE